MLCSLGLKWTDLHANFSYSKTGLSFVSGGEEGRAHQIIRS